MIDLHTHTTASDGSLTPKELVALALRHKISVLAVTDHDTMDGIPEAALAAAEAGITFIPGIEIEIEFNPGEFHLLGYGLDSNAPALVSALLELKKAREERNATIASLFASSGIDIDIEKIKTERKSDYIGRPQIAEALVAQKIVKTKQEAFDRFLGKGKPYYLPKECLSFERALKVIQQAGGVAVVAHPYSLFVRKSKLASLMDEWKERGVQGIEAYHPAAKPGPCRTLELMARERGFAVTAGSDYHNPGKPLCGIGRTSGNVPIKDQFYQELLPLFSSALSAD